MTVNQEAQRCAEFLRTPELTSVLNAWFVQGLPRSGTGIFDQTKVSTEVAVLAAQLYKRGLSGLQNQQGETVDVSAEAQQRQAEPTQDQNASPLQNASSLIPALSFLTRAKLSAELKPPLPNTFFILDSGFELHYSEWQEFALLNPGQCSVYTPSEHTKTLETVAALLDAVPKGTQRIFAAGGGITLDLAGFVAGLLNLPIHTLATTLLAAVDASIGGKTGVNFPPFGKNQVGLFVGVQSLMVVPEYFSTLSSEHFACGLAEAAKHAWLFGEFEKQAALLTRLQTAGPTTAESDLYQLVASNYNMKVTVVLADPHEKNLRKILNFGHTVAHCLEGLAEAGCLKSALPHGLAVAAGMLALVESGLVKPGPATFVEFLKNLLAVQKIELPLALRANTADVKSTASRLLAADKKNSAQGFAGAEFVLPEYGFWNLSKKHFLPQSESSEQLTRLVLMPNIFARVLPFVLQGFTHD